MAQRILFTFTAQDIGVAKAQDEVKDKLAAINKEIKAAKAAGSPYDKLLGESVKLKRETAALREEQAKLNKEFKATTVPKDSLAGLRLEYSKLTDQVNKLSAAERNSNFGKNLIKNAAGVKGQIDGIEQSMGRFTGNVGNYKSALLGVGDALTGGLVTGGIVAGVTAVISVMKLGTQIAIDYEKALDRLSAITGVTGEGLEKLQAVELSLRNINIGGQDIVNTGTDIVNALTLVGSAAPELLDDAEALGEVTRNAIVLSKASGDALNPTIEALTTTMGQFNQSAGDSARIINELAAGSKLGSSEIPQTTAALKEFGKIAELSNITTAESIALIETEAIGRLRGAEAGTQLRNILVKLASADVLPKKALAQFAKFGIDVNVLKDSTIPLVDRLKELGKTQGDVAALAKIFGVENVQGAAILTSLIPKYEELTKGIQGTNEAFIQAEIQSDNASTAIDNLGNRVQNKLQGAFQGAEPIVKRLANSLGDIITNADLGSLALKALVAPFEGKIKRQSSASSSPFDVGDPFGQSFKFGALTAQEKLAAQTRAIELAKIKGDAEDKEDDKKGGKSKAKVFKAGSLGALQKELTDLQEKINNTPGDSPLLEGLVKKAKDAEQKLQSLKNVLEEIRNPSKERTEKDDLLELATGIDPKAAIEEAKKLRDQLGAELGADNLAPQETFSSEDELAAQLDAAEAKRRKAANDQKIKDDDDLQKALIDGAISSAQTIADSVFQIQQSQLQRETDAKLAALDAQEAKAIEAANGNAAKEKAIRADFEKKRQAVEKQAAQKRKELARKEALINIALSITKALTGAVPPFNFILAGIAAIAGAAQLAVINATEFAGGGKVKRLGTGKVKEKQNAPRTAHGDTVLAYLKPGEMVLNEIQQARIAGAAGGDIFRKAGVPSEGRSHPVPFFASGGVVDFVPQASFAQQAGGGTTVTAQAAFSDEQVQQIGLVVGSIVANEVARQIRPALAEGLGDANRRLEREAEMETQRQG